MKLRNIVLTATCTALFGVGVNIASYQAHVFQARNALTQYQDTPHKHQWREYVKQVEKNATYTRILTPFAYILTSPRIPESELEYKT